jgi:hypothetical protein
MPLFDRQVSDDIVKCLLFSDEVLEYFSDIHIVTILQRLEMLDSGSAAQAQLR